MVSVGELVARLALDASQFTTGVATAQAGLKTLGREAEGEGRKVSTSMGGTSKSVQKLGETTQQTSQTVTRGLRAVTDVSSQQRMALTMFGATVSGFGAAVSAAIGGAVAQFYAFEKSIARAVGAAGGGADDMREFSATARKMGAELGAGGVTAHKAAEALFAIASAGFKGQQAIDALRPSLVLAAATQADMALITNTVISTLNQFGLATRDANRITNVFAAVNQNSLATMEKLSEAMRHAGPAAASMGKSVEEVSAALAVMFNAGLRAEMAGVGIRNIFLSLVDPSKEAEEALEAYGIRLDDVNPKTKSIAEIVSVFRSKLVDAATVTKIFGRESFIAFQALAKAGPDALHEMQRRLTGTNAAQEQLNVVMQTGSAQLDRLREAVSALSIDLGQRFLAALQPAIRGVADFASGVVGASGPMKDFAAVAGIGLAGTLTVTGALALFAAMVPTIVSGLGLIWAALGPVTLALGALAAAVYVAKKAWDVWRERTPDEQADLLKKRETVLLREIELMERRWPKAYLAALPIYKRAQEGLAAIRAEMQKLDDAQVDFGFGADTQAQINAIEARAAALARVAADPTRAIVPLTDKQRKALVASVVDWGDAMEFTQSQSNALDDALAKVGFEGGDLAKIQEHAKKTVVDWGDAMVLTESQGHDLSAALEKIGFEGGDLTKIAEHARKTTVDWGDSMVLTEEQTVQLNDALTDSVTIARSRIKTLDDEITRQRTLAGAERESAVKTAQLEALKAQAVGDYTGFVVAQFRIQAAEARTSWDGITDAVRGATSAMSSTLSDGFFQLFTEGTINAGDLFEDFTKRMARSLANFLADAAVRGFLGFALGLAGGGTIFRIGGGGGDRIPALLTPGETVLSTGQTGVLGSILRSAGLVPEGAGGNVVNTAIGTALERLGATNAATNISQGGLAGALFGLPEVPGFFEFPGQAATTGALGASGTVGQTGMTLSTLAKNVAGVAGVFGGLSGVLAAQTEGGQLGAAVALTGAVTAAMGNPILGGALALVGALMPGLFGDDDWARRRAGRYQVGADTLRSAFGALDAGDLTASAGNMRVGDLVYTMAVEQMDNAFSRNLSWPANSAFAAIRDRFGAAGFGYGAFSVGDVGGLGELISYSGRAPYEGVAAWEDLLRGVTAQLAGTTLASVPITQLAPFTDPRQALSNATELPIDLAAAAFTEQRFGLPGFTVDPDAPFGLRSLDDVGSGFGQGGVVGGPLGEPQLAVVHGGEEVSTPWQRGAGASGSDVTVRVPVYLDGHRIAEVVIDRINARARANERLWPTEVGYGRRRA